MDSGDKGVAVYEWICQWQFLSHHKHGILAVAYISRSAMLAA